MLNSLNVFIVAKPDSQSVNAVLGSKYLNKLYTNFECSDAVEVRFNTFAELVRKCKALKIDIVIVDDKKLIYQGISDVLRNNYINCLGINTFWTQLLLSNSFAKNMLEKYEINTPQRLSYPEKFPVVIKADGVLKYADSFSEVVKIQQEISKKSPEISKTMFLERYIDGKELLLTSFFDGKNLYTLPESNLNKDLLEEYNQKIEKMFRNENAAFLGYINSRIIQCDDKLYHLGFNLRFPKTDIDLLFILISAIYQKLNEL